MENVGESSFCFRSEEESGVFAGRPVSVQKELYTVVKLACHGIDLRRESEV